MWKPSQKAKDKVPQEWGNGKPNRSAHKKIGSNGKHGILHK
jgi:hypothetical protein